MTFDNTSRKKRRKHKVWASNVRKMKRNSEEQYLNRTGKEIPAKTYWFRDCH